MTSWAFDGNEMNSIGKTNTLYNTKVGSFAGKNWVIFIIFIKINDYIHGWGVIGLFFISEFISEGSDNENNNNM